MSTKRKAPGKLAAPIVRPSAKPTTKTAIDESRTSVGDTENPTISQVETIDISSDQDSDEDLSDDDDDDGHDETAEKHQVNGDGQKHSSGVNGSHDRPAWQTQNDDAEDLDGEPTSPSFGELLRGGNEAIDVPSLLQQNATPGNALLPSRRSQLAPPQLQSLTTVLTQALRTDDVDLLESCLHTTDPHTIRNTIETIESTMAGTLLTQLALRLHRRPGRAGSLMTWVQWTLIAHGGALASQPKVLQSLSGLQKVLADRSRGLTSLLALKGKLDLLEGQMDMRRRMQRQSGLIREGEDEDEDEDVIWVEGEDEAAEQRNMANGVGGRRKRLVEDDEDDIAPVLNGIMGDSSDEEDESEEEDDDSEDAEESLDEDEVDHDDVDESMGEEEDSDAEALPPSKMQKVAKASSKRK